MKTNHEEETIDLLELFYLCWHNAVKIIATALVCAVIGYLVTAFVLPKTYSASADMIVNNQEKNKSSVITDQDIQASSSLANTYAVILKSHTVLEKIISDLNLPCDYNTLEKQITVDSVSDTQVMRITVKDGDPDEAMKIVQALVDMAPSAIMDTVDVGSVKTVDEPWTTGRPVSPSKRRNTALAAMLGLIVYVGMLTLKMLNSNTFQTEADLKEVLGLPILAVIPMDKDS